jgi:hypothetical protein
MPHHITVKGCFTQTPGPTANRSQLIFGAVRRLILVASIACAWNFALAQSPSSTPDSSTPTPPNAPSQGQQSQGTSPVPKPLRSGAQLVQVLEKKSFVFPDIATNTARMSGGEKFKLAAHNSVAIATFTTALLAGAYDQAINSPAGFGQGAEGYGKRFGSIMARAATANMAGNFLVATMLHEDPRFFVERGLSFKQSVKYSARRVVVSQSDSGEKMTDFAGILGPLAAEGVANTYYPQAARGAGHIFVRYASDEAWRFGANLLRQYWPSINRKLKLVPPAPAASSN